MGHYSSNCLYSHPDMGGSKAGSINPDANVGTSFGIS
jgi:hypothetical protein